MVASSLITRSDSVCPYTAFPSPSFGSVLPHFTEGLGFDYRFSSWSGALIFLDVSDGAPSSCSVALRQDLALPLFARLPPLFFRPTKNDDFLLFFSPRRTYPGAVLLAPPLRCVCPTRRQSTLTFVFNPIKAPPLPLRHSGSFHVF